MQCRPGGNRNRAGGDAVRGASTLIRAIGDGKRVAETIRRRAAVQFEFATNESDRIHDPKNLQIAQARRVFGPPVPEISPDQRFDFKLVIQTLDEDSARQEAQRCLQCDVLCNICTTVCPNRANIGYMLDPIEFRIQQAVGSPKNTRIEDLKSVRIAQRFQIINLGDFCNECGNCTTFCPTSGAPYRVYETRDIRARLNLNTVAAEEATFLSGAGGPVDLRHAAQMAILFTALKDSPVFA